MTISKQLNTDPHLNYTQMSPYLELVRDSIRGAPFVKMKGKTYLPHPSAVDASSNEQKDRYKAYKAAAEFNEFPGHTLKTMLGKLKLDSINAELDPAIDYLIDDVDGDGLTLSGLCESLASNNLQAKWHVLVADYAGLSDVAIDDVSIEDLEEQNPRASIKQYSRENVIDWHFSRINGKMQLTYILLREVGEEFQPESTARDTIKSYLALGIDEDGYYQQKIVDSEKGSNIEGEKNHPKVNGKTLDFLPVSVVADEEIENNQMPLPLGFLSPICDLSISRYQVSADYKESLKGLQPMINVYGVNNSDWKQFKEINGREYVAVGVSCPNVWPGKETKVEFASSNATLEPYLSYFNKNTEEVRALGGVFKTDVQTQRTATEVINESEQQLSILEPLTNSIENGIKEQIFYCGMFEGIYQPENRTQAMKDIEFTMPRDYAVTKLSVEEAKEYREQYLSGLLPKEEYLKVLEVGGWTISKAEELVKQLDNLSPLV